jgi:hypothetical protein
MFIGAIADLAEAMEEGAGQREGTDLLDQGDGRQ